MLNTQLSFPGSITWLTSSSAIITACPVIQVLNTEYTLSFMREKIWPIKARAAVKQVSSLCFYCKKGRASPSQQKMASLPLDRVTPSRPSFTYVGINCLGPFQVKHGRSSAKRYGVLFTCLTVCAVHVEVTNSLDTDSFLNALLCFIARRGTP